MFPIHSCHPFQHIRRGGKGKAPASDASPPCVQGEDVSVTVMALTVAIDVGAVGIGTVIPINIGRVVRRTIPITHIRGVRVHERAVVTSAMVRDAVMMRTSEAERIRIAARGDGIRVASARTIPATLAIRVPRRYKGFLVAAHDEQGSHHKNPEPVLHAFFWFSRPPTWRPFEFWTITPALRLRGLLTGSTKRDINLP